MNYEQGCVRLMIKAEVRKEFGLLYSDQRITHYSLHHSKRYYATNYPPQAEAPNPFTSLDLCVSGDVNKVLAWLITVFSRHHSIFCLSFVVFLVA